MESRSRNIWIAVAAALLVGCCCTLTVAGAAIAWVDSLPSNCCDSGGSHRERIEETFAVGASPVLKVDSLSGNVTIRAGEAGMVRVVATKRATHRHDLDQIQVQMSQRGDELVVRTRGANLLDNAGIELEIRAPATTRLDLNTSTGSVEVHGIRNDVQVDSSSGGLTLAGVKGNIDAHSRTGGIEVREASGAVRLDSVSGGIEYQGTPQGDCRFRSLSGGVELVLPAELNMKVDLGSGSGSVEVDYAVNGRPTGRGIKGVVGDGSQGSIYAHTWSGSVELMRR
jgi:hypothetical protein